MYIRHLTDEYSGLYFSMLNTFLDLGIKEYKKIKEGTMFFLVEAGPVSSTNRFSIFMPS
jgi:hypothetical protein